MTDDKEMKPIVFCNIGWSAYYDGDENDKLIGGGSYVAEHGSGNEHLNYYPIWVSTEGSEEQPTEGASLPDKTTPETISPVAVA